MPCSQHKLSIVEIAGMCVAWNPRADAEPAVDFGEGLSTQS